MPSRRSKQLLLHAIAQICPEHGHRTEFVACEVTDTSRIFRLKRVRMRESTWDRRGVTVQEDLDLSFE